MKKFIFFLLLLLASEALYSQCYNIDSTRIPFRRENNYSGAVGFYTSSEYPSFMRSRYLYEMGLLANGIYDYQIKFRMKVDSLDCHMYCFGKYNTTYDNGWYVSYNMDENNYVEFYIDGNNGSRIQFYNLTDNDYHNYEIYYNFYTGYLDFSVDEEGYNPTLSAEPNNVDDSTTVFCVGYCGAPNTYSYSNDSIPSTNFTNYFRGYFDYIRISLGVSYPTPVYKTNFDWEFNEGAGDYAHDSITYFNGVIGGPRMIFDPPTNHLMNGCGLNYDRYNAVWVNNQTGTSPHFSAVGDGVKKFQGGNQTWEQSSVYGMTTWAGGLVATGIIGWINNPSIVDNSGGDSAKNIAFYNPDNFPPWRDLDIGLSGGAPNYTNDIGLSVTVYDNKLVAGGSFAIVGRAHTDTALNIAILDSLNGLWRDLDSGLYESDLGRTCGCNTTLEYKGDLYAGGTFWYAGKNHTRCNYIARYHDSCWTDVDSGANYDVTALVIYDSLLYVGGGFTHVGKGKETGGILSRSLAIWDGTSWYSVGSNYTDGTVTSMCVYNDELYVAGSFTTFQGISCNGLVRYSNNTWSAVGAGPEGFGHIIWEMIVYNDELYLTGSFLKMDGVYCYNICKYSGDAGFCAISNGIEGYGGALAVYNDILYVGGHFYAAEDVYCSGICVYSGDAGDNSDRLVNNMLPTTPQLKQNYPNPFNPQTHIKYYIPNDAKVKLVVYDILGREVLTLVNNEFKKAGEYTIEFNGTNYASGVYFYRLETGKYFYTKKMVLLK